MAEYRFLTVWVFDAPIESVWQEIFDFENWPSWWSFVESIIEIKPTLPNQMGSIWQITWTTPLGYKLTFDTTLERVEPLQEIAVVAQGEVEGTGLWQLEKVPEGTLVRYYWNVKTTKLWMNILAIFLRPAMEWNHNKIMEDGGQKLAQRLQARLISRE